MKIYLDQLPPTLASGQGQWWVVKAIIDRLLMALAYLATVAASGGRLQRNDFIVVLIILMVSAPGRIPFRRMSAAIAWQIVRQWALTVASVGLVAVVLGGIFPAEAVLVQPRIAAAWSALSLLVLLAVHSFSPTLTPHVSRLYKKEKVLIVGINDVAMRLSRLIANGEADGQQLVGYIEDRSPKRLQQIVGQRVVGRFDEIGDRIRANGVSVIYLAVPMSRQPRVLALLEQLRDTTASVFFVPDVFVAELVQGRVGTVAGLPMVAVCDTPMQEGSAIMKRALDLAITIPALPFLLPVLGVIALLIKSTSEGPAIFSQRRFGLDGREITVLKFRTMKVMEDGQATYTQVTPNDDRVTPIGRFLRRTSLDELPQVFNVLAGSMSLVGPRPHAIAVNEQYRKLIAGYMIRHKVKPGITGWAQVHGQRGGNDLHSMRKRTEYDLAYLRTWSLGLDLRILWKTAVMLVRGDMNAY